jgi:hypothetical protein
MKPIPIAQYLAQFGKADLAETETPRRENLLLRPRLVQPREDVEARIEEAFERGRRKGIAEARADVADAAMRDQIDVRERALAERLDFQANEYAELSEKIVTGLAEIEERVAASVARILKPYLIEEHSKLVVQALSSNLTRILSGDGPTVLKIRGRKDVLGMLHERLSMHPVEVEYVAEDSVDVRVEAQQTVIESQLQAWIDHIQAIGD